MDCVRKLGFVHLGGTQIKLAIRNCIVVAGSALEKYVFFFFLICTMYFSELMKKYLMKSLLNKNSQYWKPVQQFEPSCAGKGIEKRQVFLDITVTLSMPSNCFRVVELILVFEEGNFSCTLWIKTGERVLSIFQLRGVFTYSLPQISKC